LSENKTLASQAVDLFDGVQFRQYLEFAQRRKWWIILAATAIFAACMVVVLRLPNTYRSETVIMVDPQKVPDSYVPSTVNATVIDRLSIIRHLVLSPSRLQRVIELLNLYPELRKRGDDQRAIEVMQKAIAIEVGDAGSQRLSAFRIAFTGKTGQEAADVANQLAAMVIVENLKSRQQQFSGTAQFLETQLQDTKRQLEEKEGELERIKAQNIMDLPESKQYHLEALTSLRNQLRASQDRMNRAQQEKVYLQSLLFATNPAVDLDADATGMGGSPLESQIQKLESRLSELRSRYAPNHPDVRKVQAQVDELKRRMASEATNGPTAEPAKPTQRGSRNPVIESQLAKLDQEIQEQTMLQGPLQEQINFNASKLERVPIFEQRIAGLMRDYDILRANYNRMLDKKISAGMANELETRQQGERFVVLDRAPVPERPTGPNRPLIGLGALLGALIGGIALGMLVEMTDESVRSEREAASILGKPIVGTIPRILTEAQRRRERLRLVGALAGTVACSVAAGFLISYASGWFF
jgi:succinoglycan biosynthesis transport protein ExoP